MPCVLFQMEACRICMTNIDLNQIFHANSKLADDIVLIASVEVKEHDGFPQYICNLCKNDLFIAINFKRKCERTYQFLLSIQRNNEDIVPFGKLKANENVLFNKALLTYHNSDSNFVKNNKMPDDQFEKTIQNIPNSANHEDDQFEETNHKNVSHETAYEEPGCNSEHCFSECSTKQDVSSKCVKHTKKSTRIHKRNVQCHLCGKVFGYKAEIIRHLWSHYKYKQFKCIECCTEFTQKSALVRHLSKHSGVRKFECVQCSKSFTHQSNLNTHMKIHSGEKRFSCNVCLKKFRSNRNLNLHLKIHSNERNFPCDKCDKAFVNKYDLLRHFNLHEKKRQIEKGVYDRTKEDDDKIKQMLQCERCGKICFGNGDLKKHMRIHTDERPFVCSYCDKRFKTSSTLHSHERIHNKKRPYVCKYCGRGFAQSSNLHTHERLHSGEKPFACTLCDKSFNRKRDLVNHMAKHEPNNKLDNVAYNSGHYS